jgi:hypothetical protein
MRDTMRNRAIVERMAAGASMKGVADEFGITKERVSQIPIRLTGESQPQPDPWPAERIARLRVLLDRGLRPADIALRLGVSGYAVLGKIYRLRRQDARSVHDARPRSEAHGDFFVSGDASQAGRRPARRRRSRRASLQNSKTNASLARPTPARRRKRPCSNTLRCSTIGSVFILLSAIEHLARHGWPWKGIARLAA